MHHLHRRGCTTQGAVGGGDARERDGAEVEDGGGAIRSGAEPRRRDLPRSYPASPPPRLARGGAHAQETKPRIRRIEVPKPSPSVALVVRRVVLRSDHVGTTTTGARPTAFASGVRVRAVRPLSQEPRCEAAPQALFVRAWCWRVAER